MEILRDIVNNKQLILLFFGAIFIFFAALGKIEVKEFKTDLGKFGRGIALFFGTLFIIIALAFSDKPSKPPDIPSSPPITPPISTITPNPIFKYYIEKGFQEFDNKNYSGAENYYTKATELDPNSPIAWNGLGLSSDMLGKNKEAIQALKNAINLDNSKPDYLVNLGNVYIKNKEYNEALNPLRQATIIAPKLPEALSSYAIAKCHNGQYDESIAKFTDSILLKANPIIDDYRNRAMQAKNSGETSLCPIP